VKKVEKNFIFLIHFLEDKIDMNDKAIKNLLRNQILLQKSDKKSLKKK